ncbi:hypothetical protein ASAP_2978 [Asaia bogorensis]|uniref:Uncharacterized protein n=1 Tax=Asaia bogorensis TaxID=91915 RepID=A0A060QJW7_9PROT|nr:hypothetical protein P792_04995 [Asaia sp. SF2.1]CDG41023.1 hypothetical protein ASAP_2978 [Asaia bogorensis]
MSRKTFLICTLLSRCGRRFFLENIVIFSMQALACVTHLY